MPEAPYLVPPFALHPVFMNFMGLYTVVHCLLSEQESDPNVRVPYLLVLKMCKQSIKLQITCHVCNDCSKSFHVSHCFLLLYYITIVIMTDLCPAFSEGRHHLYHREASCWNLDWEAQQQSGLL